MQIVFFTNSNFRSDPLRYYILSHVAANFPNTHIVAVRSSGKLSWAKRAKRLQRKLSLLGWLGFLEVLAFLPLQRIFSKYDSCEIDRRIRTLPQPVFKLDTLSCYEINSVNGHDAVSQISALSPDVIIQAGAGILRPQVFNLAKIATINLHHGIAPLIKGMSSINWALWENRPEWIGCTVHVIDSGIDTGKVLAYAPIAPAYCGEQFPSIFVSATISGVEKLIETLRRLERGEKWSITPLLNEQNYRSTFSGLKHLVLELKLLWRRRGRQ